MNYGDIDDLKNGTFSCKEINISQLKKKERYCFMDMAPKDQTWLQDRLWQTSLVYSDQRKVLAPGRGMLLYKQALKCVTTLGKGK